VPEIAPDSAAERASNRALTRAIALMSFAAFASGFSLRISDPLLPQVALEFGTSIGAASTIVTAYAIPYGLTQAFSGSLGDRFGKCQAVTGTCLLSCLIVLLCGFSQSLPQLAIARFVCAPAAATIVPLGMAYVGDVVPYERRQPTLARFLAGQMTGMIAGQIAGGVIGDHFGWRTVFFVLAVVFGVAGGALMTQFGSNPWTRPLKRSAESRPGLVADYGKLIKSRWALFLCAAVFCEGAIFFGGFTYISADMHDRFALNFSVIGGVVAGFGVGSILFAMSVHRLVGRLGQRGLVIGGGLVVMAAYAMLAGAPVWQTAPLATAMLGFGYYMLHNTLQTNATQMLPEARGTAVAAFSSALFLGQSAGVTIAAPLYDHGSAAAVFGLAAVLWPLLAIWITRRLGRR
jgi:predicted MFS family arabinose efflux permease